MTGCVGMCASVLKSMQILVSLCACVSMLLLTLSLFTKCLTRSVTMKNVAVCVSLLLFLKQNHSPPHPFILCPHPHSSHLPLLMAAQPDPPLAKSRHITPHPNQGAGWRRWPVSAGPLTRYQSERQTSFTVCRKESGDTWLFHTYLSWILFTPAERWKTTLVCRSRPKEQTCFSTHCILVFSPFRSEQRLYGDGSSIFLHFATLWASGWCDCILTG